MVFTSNVIVLNIVVIVIVQAIVRSSGFEQADASNSRSRSTQLRAFLVGTSSCSTCFSAFEWSSCHQIATGRKEGPRLERSQRRLGRPAIARASERWNGACATTSTD
jgi:hypothetical protein